MARCSGCQKRKPRTSFPKSKGGRYAYCKVCHRDRQRKYRSDHPERVRRANRLTQLKREEHPRQYKTRWWRQYLKREYNVSPDEIKALYRSQGHRCAICKRKKKLCVDHNHRTGKVRGLLCVDCNTGLGKLGDSLRGLMRAIKYLRQ